MPFVRVAHKRWVRMASNGSGVHVSHSTRTNHSKSNMDGVGGTRVIVRFTLLPLGTSQQHHKRVNISSLQRHTHETIANDVSGIGVMVEDGDDGHGGTINQTLVITRK